MALAQGDIIIGKDGERWTVEQIYGYLWRDRLYHKGYWLIRNNNQDQRYLSRRKLCWVFGGIEGHKGGSDDTT